MNVRDASDVVITSNLIERFSTGLMSQAASGHSPSTLGITGNSIINNGETGLLFESQYVSAYTGPDVTMNGNDIYGNTTWNLYLGDYQDPGSTVIDVEGNWWGTTSPTEIESKIFDYYDDTSSPVADYTPFRSGPILPSDPDISVAPIEFFVEIFPGGADVVQLTISNTGLTEPLTFSFEEAVGGASGASRDAWAHPSNLVASGQVGVVPTTRADVPWLSEDPVSGSVPPQGAEVIDVTVDSDGLAEGFYTAYLLIRSNDIDEDPLVVPVVMHVSPVFLTSPDGGEQLAFGEWFAVTWMTESPEAVDQVDLYYSCDGGNTYDSIAEGLPNTQSYDWYVPAVESDSCLVRVVAHYSPGGEYSDTSDRCFSIGGGTSVPDDGLDGSEVFRIVAAPNPSASSVSLELWMMAEHRAEVAVYDVAGRLVAEIASAQLHSGRNTLMWNGRSADGARLPSGVYFVRAEAGGRQANCKVLLIR